MKDIYIYKAFVIILISVLFLLFINQSYANDNKKCVIYRDGKLEYNPDNPKIHCNTYQILDNFWDDNNVNVPNKNKAPEEFAEILVEEEIISNGKAVCKNLSTSNASFSKTIALEGNTIKGVCNSGYTGNISATCQKDTTWSITNNCLSDCNNLNNMYEDIDFKNALTSISDSETVYSKCNPGYNGYKKHICEDGTLNTTQYCTLNTSYCPSLSRSYGTVSYSNSRAINSVATFSCNTGYYKSGTTSVICDSTGNWNATLGSCVLNKSYCSSLSRSGGSVSYSNSRAYNSTATLSCNTGYYSSGYTTATCNSSGSWNRTLGNCYQDTSYCSSLSRSGGSISYSNYQAYNSTATLSCNTGYALSGYSSATCNSSGYWSRTLGSCERVYSNCYSKSYSFSIKICTNKGDSDCYYDYDPSGSCNLSDNYDYCTVSGTVSLAHGESITKSYSCYFKMISGPHGGGTDGLCGDVSNTVSYKIKCYDGVLSVSKP